MEDFTDDKDLDSIFTRAIDAAETLPSDKFWSKVSEEVLWKENRSFRRKAFAWRSVALLFSFLTVLLATYVFYVNNKITTIEKKITTLELQTTKNQTDANTNEKSNINKNAIVQGSNNGVAVNVPNTNQAGDNDSKTITNSKNHSLPKHNTVLTDNGGSGKSIAATISSSLTTTGKMGKANNGYYTNNENGVEAKASTLNNDIKSTVPGNDSSAASAKAGLVNIGNVNDSLQKSQTVSITRSGKTSDSAIVSLPKAKAIMPVAVETTEEPAKPIDKVKLLSRISLSAFFSPKIEEDFLKDDDDNKTLGNTAKDVKTRETDKFAYSTGIRLGFDISKHWSVFTGLNYYGSSVSIRPILSPAQQLQDGRLGYSVVTSSGVVNFSDAAMQTQPGDSIKATIESSRHYISVPLHLQYDFALARRFDFYINGGFAINFAETNAATVHWENSRFQDGNITVRNIPDVDGIQYSYVLAAGAKYRLVKGLYVFLEPGIQGSMAAINKNAPVKTYPLFLQGTGGLTFHF